MNIVVDLEIPEKPLIGDRRTILYDGNTIYQLWTGKQWIHYSLICVNDNPCDVPSFDGLEGKVVSYNDDWLDTTKWKDD